MLAPVVTLSLHHAPWCVVGAGGRAGASVELVEGGVWVRVPVLDTQMCADAWTLVSAGVIGGWSMEVWPLRMASLPGGWVEIQRGLVTGVSLVVDPAFARSWVRAEVEA